MLDARVHSYKDEQAPGGFKERYRMEQHTLLERVRAPLAPVVELPLRVPSSPEALEGPRERC